MAQVPDLANKIIVGIISANDKAPMIREWSGEGIADDVDAAQEIALFIKENDVARVITSEWVLSCPHEEGVDYQKAKVVHSVRTGTKKLYCRKLKL